MPVINMKYYPVIGGLSPANIMIPNEQINIMEHHVGVLNTAHVTKLKESSAKVKISVTVTPSASWQNVIASHPQDLLQCVKIDVLPRGH